MFVVLVLEPVETRFQVPGWVRVSQPRREELPLVRHSASARPDGPAPAWPMSSTPWRPHGDWMGSCRFWRWWFWRLPGSMPWRRLSWSSCCSRKGSERKAWPPASCGRSNGKRTGSSRECPVNSHRARHAANHEFEHRAEAGRRQAGECGGKAAVKAWRKPRICLTDSGPLKRPLSVIASYQPPIFGAEAQGSATGRFSPFCRISNEMPSGDFTKAMRPSRGGRLMVMPASDRRWQNS